MSKIKEYDNKCVKIIDKFGEEFLGICTYNNKEYNLCEFGTNEESLDIINFKFYKSIIKKVIILEDENDWYNKFINSYGLIEKLNVEDGIDSIYEVLYSNCKEHILRLLLYIDENVDKKSNYYNEIVNLLSDYLKYEEDENIVTLINKIIKEGL